MNNSPDGIDLERDEWDASGKFRARAIRPGQKVEWGRVAEVFPSKRLGRPNLGYFSTRPMKRLSYFPQYGYADCGAACLYMSLSYLNIDVDIEAIRERLSVSRDGVRASAIVRTARAYGTNARGVRMNMSGLRSAAAGTILFWKFNHFVVLERVLATGVVIVDPASGRRTASFAEVDSSFTGLAIEISLSSPRPRKRFKNRADGAWRTLSQFVPTARGLWFSAFLSSAVIVAASITLPLAVRASINSVSSVADTSVLFGIGIAVAVATAGAMHQLRSRTLSTLQGMFEDKAGTTLVARLLNVENHFFQTRHPGDLAQRARIGSSLRQLLSNATVGAAMDATLICVILVVMAAVNSSLTVVALGFVILAVTVTAIGARRQMVLSAVATDARLRSAGLLHEVLDVMSSVKALGAEREIRNRWQNFFADEITTGVSARRHLSAINSFATWMQFATPAMTLAVGMLLFSGGHADLGSVVAVSVLTSTLFASIVSLITSFMQIASAKPELERVSDIMNAPLERVSDGPLEFAEHGVAIETKGLGYSYPGSRSAALTDVTVSVRPGGFLGVLGPSGSGKSTLGSILAALTVPSTGAVYLDSFDTREVGAQRLREAIGYVEQNSRLMSGSILDNMRLAAPGSSLEEVRAAAAIAEIDEFICGLPMGYSTILGSRGDGLSGGQKQRIALARALLKHPPLLILDEATSAVDPEVEKLIFANIRSKLGGTLVVIAHRADLFVEADRILVIDSGRVVTDVVPGETDVRQEGQNGR